MSENNSLAVVTETELNNIVVLPNHQELMQEVARLKAQLAEKERRTVAKNSYGLNAEKLEKRTTATIPWSNILADVSGLSLPEAIEKSGMNYGVEKIELSPIDNPGQKTGCFAIRRTDNGVIVSGSKSVGSQYTPLSNEKRWEAVKEFIGNGWEMAYAGDLYDGAKSVIILKQPGDMVTEIRKNDVVMRLRMFTDGYDGLSVGYYSDMDMRLRCYNGAMSLDKMGSAKFRHGRNVEIGVKRAERELSLADARFEEKIQKYKLLAAKPFQDNQLESYIADVMEMERKENKKTGQIDYPTRTMGIINNIKSLIHGGFGNGEGTWFDAYNGITQYFSHEFGRNQVNRVDSLLFGTGANKANTALEVAVQMAS